MKLSFHPSPNYRDAKSTSEIMRDLTVCLLAVLLFSAVWYGVSYGAAYGIRVILMAVFAVIAALCTEACYFRIRKQDVKEGLKHSYGWVTALILVEITKISVSYYAVIIATILAIVFGKLVFGGFGQNIFNPAAFGEAIIMNSFASSTAADFTTGATPMAAMKSAGWIMDGSSFGTWLGQFHGWAGMLTGNYTAVIGGTSVILLLLCYLFLVLRKDIDWETTAVYLITVFAVSLFAGLFNGDGVWFAFFNLLSGGTVFLAVFMLTDPVTSPVTKAGRVIFAVGAACLTLTIRWRANLPDGALYSVLLMNMLTPAIELAMDGSQIKDFKRMQKRTWIVCLVCVVIAIALGGTMHAKADETASTAASAASTAETAAAASNSGDLTLSSDFSENEASCEAKGDGVYACTAKGFGLLSKDAPEGESANEAEVTVKDGKVASVKVTKFGDTKGVGDNAAKDDALAAYEGADLDSSVDITTGATYTSKSIASMVQAALQADAK